MLLALFPKILCANTTASNATVSGNEVWVFCSLDSYAFLGSPALVLPAKLDAAGRPDKGAD